jgi:hypothetical protein
MAISCAPAAAVAAAGGLVAMTVRLDQGQAQLKADQLVLEQQLQCLATVLKEQNLGIKALIEEQYKVFHAKLDLLEEKMVSKLNNIENMLQLKGHR